MGKSKSVNQQQKNRFMPKKRYLCIVCLVFILVLLLDAISKWLVQTELPLISRSYPWYPYGGVGVFKNFLGIEFSIVHETNKGAAWGAFADFQSYLMALRIVLVIGLIAYLVFYNKQKAMTVPLLLILAGALGNVVDFFIYGHVVDMFHFVFGDYHFPVFNVADASIFIGVAWISIQSLFFEKSAPQKIYKK